MPKKLSSTELAALLPWYANGTLSPTDRQAVEAALAEDSTARQQLTRLQHLQTIAVSQPRLAPPPQVQTRLLAQMETAKPRRTIGWRLTWAWGTVAALIILLGLWAIVQPGLAVEWSTQGQGASAFRVYRTVAGSDHFELIGEVPARPDLNQYTVNDPTPLPGQIYTYFIEAVTPDGRPIISQSVVGNGLDALPAQLALLATSLIAGYAVIAVLRSQGQSNSQRRWARA